MGLMQTHHLLLSSRFIHRVFCISSVFLIENLSVQCLLYQSCRIFISCLLKINRTNAFRSQSWGSWCISATTSTLNRLFFLYLVLLITYNQWVWTQHNVSYILPSTIISAIVVNKLFSLHGLSSSCTLVDNKYIFMYSNMPIGVI
jgi:hypothetical protein